MIQIQQTTVPDYQLPSWICQRFQTSTDFCFMVS